MLKYCNILGYQEVSAITTGVDSLAHIMLCIRTGLIYDERMKEHVGE